MRYRDYEDPKQTLISTGADLEAPNRETTNLKHELVINFKETDPVWDREVQRSKEQKLAVA
jgi:hypothetical protein